MTFDSTTLLIIAGALVVLILAFLLLRSRKPAAPIERRGEPYVASRERPYVKPPRTDGVTDEVAAATTDVAGEVLGVDAHGALSGDSGSADNLQKLKGVGPKMIARLHELGIVRFQQLATLNDTELAHLDERMGPFRGRLARDRVVEQADYLARGDIDGFEERFGKLGS